MSTQEESSPLHDGPSPDNDDPSPGHDDPSPDHDDEGFNDYDMDLLRRVTGSRAHLNLTEP